MHPEILNQNQAEIIKRLSFIRERGFYLAGGTGLALQLGHRTSVDFDFYTFRKFNPDELLRKLKTRFKQLKVLQLAEDVLTLTTANTELSFFPYPYKLLASIIKFEGVDLASIKDIAAMKLATIVQRGKRRDFIDIYYLLKKYSLDDLIKFALKKFAGYQPMLFLRGLIYFVDAEEEEFGRGMRIFDKNFSWKKAKKEIINAVKDYQLKMIS